MKSHVLQRSVSFRLSAMVGVCILLSTFQAVGQRIGEITRGKPAVSLPKSSTDNLPVRYGLGFPVQLGPTTAGLFCNLRVVGPKRSDYEDGCDMFVFDDLGNVGQADPTAISRNEKESDVETGKLRFIEKFPAIGGFWPLVEASGRIGASGRRKGLRHLSGTITDWQRTRTYLGNVQLAFHQAVHGNHAVVLRRQTSVRCQTRSAEEWPEVDDT